MSKLCGAVNIYLRMCGFPQSPSVFYRAVIKRMIPLWKTRMRALGGVAAKGGEVDDKPPVNPEGAEVDEPQGGRMTIKTTISAYAR